MLPTNLKILALSRAHKDKVSLGELIRKGLKLLLKQPSEKSSKIADPFYADNRVFAGEAPSDLSVNHDHYLYGEKS